MEGEGETSMNKVEKEIVKRLEEFTQDLEKGDISKYKQTKMKLPKITAKQEGGDDGYCYVIRIDGKEFINGLTRSEVPYHKAQALKQWKEKYEKRIRNPSPKTS